VRYARLLVSLSCAASLACGKARPGVAGAPEASAAADASAPRTASASATGAVPGAPLTWRGTYTSAPGTLTIPPRWKDVHWSPTDTTTGIGQGTLDLSIDPITRHVVGSVEGPLGPASIAGVEANDTITANVARRDPADRGFSGTLVAEIAQGRCAGTIRGSLAEAGEVLTASFALAPGAR
jgi:hypothetical protein